MHQWVQQKELNNKNEQSVVIIILVATLFFSTFFENCGIPHIRLPPCSDLISIPKIGGKIMAYNKTSEERKWQAKKLYFLFI